MASIPVYQTWVAGTVVSAAQLASNIQAPGNFFLARPYVNVYNAAGVVAGTSGTGVLVPFDTELEDNDNMHAVGTNPSRVICQTPGMFKLAGASDWPSNATGTRRIDLRLNSGGSMGGGTFLALRSATPNAATGTAVLPEINMPYRFVNIGDYIEMFLTQTSGGSLTSPGGVNALYLSALWEIA